MEFAGRCFGEKTKDLQPEWCNFALTGWHKAFLYESNTQQWCGPRHRGPPPWIQTMILGDLTSGFNTPGKYVRNSDTQ
jgi:hypothetical protein